MDHIRSCFSNVFEKWLVTTILTCSYQVPSHYVVVIGGYLVDVLIQSYR